MTDLERVLGYGLSPTEIAGLIGVHVSSVYRLRASSGSPRRALARSLLGRLSDVGPRRAREVAALVHPSGVLAALRLLLGGVPREARRAVARQKTTRPSDRGSAGGELEP